MKRLIILLLAVLLLAGQASAAAMNEYALSPFAADTQAMLALAFGDQAGDAQTDDREYPFYSLPGTDGAPFCGQDDTAGFGQTRLFIYTALTVTEDHEPYIWDNIEPSGAAKCALTAGEAQAQAEAILRALGITEYTLQGVTAYGRIDGLTSGYMAAFGETVDGVPVYWAAALHYDEMTWVPESNRIEINLGDNGLALLQGGWAAFTPTRKGISIIAEDEAVAALQALGEDAGTAELCYLLTGTQEAPVALPAYRFQNRFVSAEDGAVLQ